MRDLESRLSSLKEVKSSLDERLRESEEEGATLRAQLSTARSELEQRQSQLQETTDKVGGANTHRPPIEIQYLQCLM